MKRRLATITAAFSMLGTGCVGDANARLELGTRRTATFETRANPDALGMAAGLSRPRAEWMVTPEVAPIDGVIHAPHWRHERRLGRRADRWEINDFPQVSEARPEGGDDAWEAAGELGRSAADVGLWAWRAVREPAVTWSPRIIWKRQPAGRARVGTVAASREDGND